MSHYYNMTGCLLGDIFLQRKLNLNIPNIKEIQQLLSENECTIANLETTVHSSEGNPAAFPGGGYAMAPPIILNDLKELGISMVNIANNHMMDYGEAGLLATIKHLDKENIPHCGAGANLSQASKAAFYEGKNARIAIIGVTSSFHDSYSAGPQNQDFLGRAGVSPLRHNATYLLPSDDYNRLLDLGSKIGINEYHNQAKKEGYLLGDTAKFGIYSIKCSNHFGYETTPNQNDLQRTLGIIRDAKRQADIVVVNVHGHQFADGDKQIPPDFVKDFSHACINNGATFVVGTGPHVLRGIECYNNGIIFYGLGNFIFQHEQMDMLPEEFYQKYGQTRSSCDGVGEILSLRSNNGTRGLCIQPQAWESIIIQFSCTNQDIYLNIIPVEIDYYTNNALKGLPRITNQSHILSQLQTLSKPFNTSFEITNNIGHLHLTIPN